jgi:hypothetical protein
LPVDHGLSPVDTDRLSACLDRLLPHLRLDGVAITGGVGLQWGLAARGRQRLRRELADLDLVAASIDAIGSTVAGQFLVSHYHVVQPGVPKFMIQLVDPPSRIRIDVFPDVVGALADARTMAIGKHAVQVLPLERIFEHKVRTLARASQSTPIDPKHVRDAQILGELLGTSVPGVAQEALAPDVYGIESDWFCERCQLSRHPSWPLAPRDRIFELLAWRRQSSCQDER